MEPSPSSTSWERFKNNNRYYPEVGFALDFSRMNFPAGFLAGMMEKVEASFAAMEELEKGAIANPDEGRMVGHYWLRNEALAPDQQLQNTIRNTQTIIINFVRSVHTGKVLAPSGKPFTDVILVGIGGSALGPQLLADALGTDDDKMAIHFCDNTDPDGISRLLSGLESKLSETLVVVVSKSGGTIETRNGCLEVQAALRERGLPAEKQMVAVTSDGSKLDSQAKKEGWLAVFPMWDWVGGRTSLFSAVGLVPAALQGIDIVSFLEGAKQMDELTRRRDTDVNSLNNPAMLLALMWFYAGEGRGKKDMVILPYKDRLVLFSKYLQQLVMESIGKEKDLKGETVNQGIAVYGNKGSTDQHAYVQQLRDGVPNFFATFIRVLKDFSEGTRTPRKPLEVDPGILSGDYLQGFYMGTRLALSEKGRESMTITMNVLSAFSLGALIALYERAVGFYANLVGINAYHQPGVEAGKKAAGRVIELQQLIISKLKDTPGGCTAEEMGRLLSVPAETESIYLVLEYLAENRRFSIAREGDRIPGKSIYRMHT